MRRLVAFWIKEWLALSRDPHGLAVLFVMPAAFIVIMSLALSDVFDAETRRDVAFAVLTADGARGDNVLAQRLARRLAGDGFDPVPAPADEATARERVRAGNPKLVLVVPAGLEADLPAQSGNAPGLVLLADPTLPPMQLAAFRQRVLGAVFGMRIAATAGSAGLSLDEKALDMKRAVPIRVEVVGNPRAGRPSSVQQNVPAWLIFGMFFVVMPMSSLLIVERREGTLARLASQRVPFWTILLGKTVPYFIINLVQAALMLLAGRTLVPWLGGEVLQLPARWDLLALVAASTSLAAVAWGLLVAVTARTMEQATVIGGVGNILAAAIGGIMVPRFVMSDAMQAWVDLSPMAWALEGFHAVILRQGVAADVLAPCLKLALLAAALLALALWVYRHRRT